MRLRKRYCFMTVLAFMFFNDLRLPGCAPGAAFSCASGAAFSPNLLRRRTSPPLAPKFAPPPTPVNATWLAAPPVALTVAELRALHGEGRDLGARQTRELYHTLLPTSLLKLTHVPIAQRAAAAVAARRAARLYARERSVLPLAVAVACFDGARQLARTGQFAPEGLSEEEVWSKYCDGVDGGDEDELCATVLRKSCSTTPAVDALVGLPSPEIQP